MTENDDIKRLKSKVQIDRVFNNGKTIISGQLIMHFISGREEYKETHIGVGVSKRAVQLAYRRNRIKRQIRAIIKKKRKVVLRVLPQGFYMVLYKGRVCVTSKKIEEDFDGVLKNFTINGGNT